MVGGERGAKPRLNENNIYIRNQWVFALLNNINNSVLQFYNGNNNVATCILNITNHHMETEGGCGGARPPESESAAALTDRAAIT